MTKIKVTVETLISTIRHLEPRVFGSFHLSTCHCGLPTWKQPCKWCSYYPDWGSRSTGTHIKADAYASVEEFKKQLRGRSLFENYCDWNCVSEKFNAYTRSIAAAVNDLYEWPTAEEIFAAFGKGCDLEKRKRYNLEHLYDEDRATWLNFRRLEAAAEGSYWGQELADITRRKPQYHERDQRELRSTFGGHEENYCRQYLRIALEDFERADKALAALRTPAVADYPLTAR